MTAAFDAVFAVFVLAMVVVAVLAVRWAVGRDRAARAARAEQELRRALDDTANGEAGPATGAPR
ncbi:MAG TPA: hypothetical protein VE991_09475 [Acidimicrobiales bacterium]|nr:hypothetical protein [Acidimicrobiales bacterium]